DAREGQVRAKADERCGGEGGDRRGCRHERGRAHVHVKQGLSAMRQVPLAARANGAKSGASQPLGGPWRPVRAAANPAKSAQCPSNRVCHPELKFLSFVFNVLRARTKAQTHGQTAAAEPKAA